MDRLRNSLYFFLSVRVVVVVCGIIVLFSVALTDGWSNRYTAIIGLIFLLLGVLFTASAIAVLYFWDLKSMSLAKRSVFIWVALLCYLVSAVMFLISPQICDRFNQFGSCFESNYSPGFKVAAAFCFLMFFFSVFDVALNFIFHFRSERNPEDEEKSGNPAIQPSTLNVEPPTISVVDVDSTTADFEPYLRQAVTTYV